MENEIIIPQQEYELKFSHAPGPGGQNINKRNTRVQLFFNIGASQTLSDDQKILVRKKLASHISQSDQLIVESQEERMQEQNRQRVIEKLHDLINGALAPEKKRIPTKPTRASIEKRLKEKKELSEKKTRRRVA